MTRVHFSSRLLFAFLGFVTTPLGTTADDQSTLADKANAVLKQHCYRCHGQDGTLEGGLGYILDRERLVARKKILPGDAAQSSLFKRVAAGKMPPPSVKERPSAAEVELLRRWIDAGAVAAGPKRPDRPPISEAAVLTLIRDDLETLERRSRRFTRYFSLAHLANQGLTAEELQTYRNALAKLLNSLSWHPRILIPRAIDREGLVLRIDLRDLMWDATLWNRLVAEYPYGVIHDSAAARSAIVGAAARVPVVRADWFIATASRPPLYYDLLQMPTSAAELERQLRVDVAQNILQERIARAGFNGSGVSRNNRVLERHDAVHGAYWRTYDFDAIPQNLAERDILLPDRRNLFAYPLGPGGTDNTFQHAGGEVIFNLPNGLHAFLLVNAVNTRIDKGPTAIVSDPKRPDRAVEPGVSCMACHFTGILQKSDQIRDHVGRNKKYFSAKDTELIRALYPDAERMKKLMDEDAERYRVALEKTGNRINKVEPVSTLTLRYEADVDLDTAAAEVGLRPQDYLQRVLSQESVSRNLGGLKVQGGTVARQALVQAFGDVARSLRLGTVLQAGATGQNLPDNTGEVDPLEGAANQTNAVAFSRDGRRALLASADRSVRLWDVEAGRELKRFVGHSASVWSVAFAPDARRAASGGVDTVIRIWDIEAANEVRRLEGHNGLVVAVAFSSDGKRLLSAALDHSVILWDLETGKELRRLDGVKHVSAVAVARDDRQALVCGGNTVVRFDLETGKVLHTYEGHADSVTAAQFTPDGKWIVSASDDGTARLWETTGRVIREFKGHESCVRSVALSPDGKQLATASSDATVRLWELASGKELKKFAKHNAGLLTVAFTPEGQGTLSGSNDADVRVWELVKGRPATPPEQSPSSVAPEAVKVRSLKPTRVLSLPRPAHALHLSPNGRWLYYLSSNGAAQLERIDTETFQRGKPLVLSPGTETLTLSPDGKTLAALVSREGRAEIQLIDAPKWAKRNAVTVAFDAYDLALDDRGRVYLSGVSRDWADVAVVNSADGAVLGRWGGIWTRSLLRLSQDQKRLYVSSQGVTPGSLDAFVIPSRLDEKAALYKSPARTERNLGGDFVLAPDGRYLLCKNGTVLKTAADAESDLRLENDVRPFLAAAFAPELGAFLTTSDGRLQVYPYPDLKWRTAYQLAGVGHQAVIGVGNRLFVVVFDPQSLTLRPSERGGGELHEYALPVTGH